jgi:hypothetical protein
MNGTTGELAGRISRENQLRSREKNWRPYPGGSALGRRTQTTTTSEKSKTDQKQKGQLGSDGDENYWTKDIEQWQNIEVYLDRTSGISHLTSQQKE